MTIGKRGVWTEEQMKLHRPDVFYNLFALDTKRVQDPVWFNSFLQSIVTDFKQVFLHICLTYKTVYKAVYIKLTELNY